jgi:hypothetical protein
MRIVNTFFESKPIHLPDSKKRATQQRRTDQKHHGQPGLRSHERRV